MKNYFFDKRVIKKRAVKYVFCFAVSFPVVYTVNTMTQNLDSRPVAFLLQVLAGFITLMLCELLFKLFQIRKGNKKQKDVVVIRKNALRRRSVKFELKNENNNSNQSKSKESEKDKRNNDNVN